MSSNINDCLELDSRYVVTVIITILIVIFVFWIINMDHDDKMHDSEAFSSNYSYYPNTRFCTNCDNRSYSTCANCTNCGYCYTSNGYGECVPGDENGPYFRTDCLNYEYNTPVAINDIYYPRWWWYWDNNNNRYVRKNWDGNWYRDQYGRWRRRNNSLNNQVTNQVNNRVDNRYNRLDNRYNRVDNRYNRLDNRYNRVDNRYNRVDNRYNQLNRNRRWTNSDATSNASTISDLSRRTNLTGTTGVTGITGSGMVAPRVNTLTVPRVNNPNTTFTRPGTTISRSSN